MHPPMRLHRPYDIHRLQLYLLGQRSLPITNVKIWSGTFDVEIHQQRSVQTEIHAQSSEGRKNGLLLSQAKQLGVLVDRSDIPK